MSTFEQPDFRKPGVGFQPGPGAGSGAVQPGGVFIFGRSGPLDNEKSLRAYLLIRAVARSVLTTLQWSGIAILVLAAALWLGGLKVLGILVGLVALAVLGFRALLSGLGRRMARQPDPRLHRLVIRTGRGLRREFRRVGLPGTPWAPLLIALRLIRPRRRVATMQALTKIDLARVVPSSQVDELHLLLQSTGR